MFTFYFRIIRMFLVLHSLEHRFGFGLILPGSGYDSRKKVDLDQTQRIKKNELHEGNQELNDTGGVLLYFFKLEITGDLRFEIISQQHS